MADSPGKEKTAAAVTFEGFNLIEIPCTDVDLQTVQADQLAAYENAVHDQQQEKQKQQVQQNGEAGDDATEVEGKEANEKGGGEGGDAAEGARGGAEGGDGGDGEGGFAPRGSTPQLKNRHQNKHSWAMQQLYNAPKPVALAPLRWNLRRIERDYADHISGMEDRVHEREAELKGKHRQEAAKLKQKIVRDVERAKATIPGGLNGRIKKLHSSVDNLTRLGRLDAAAATARRIPDLEDKFWNDKLGGDGGVLQAAKRRERKLREKQTVELARAKSETRGEVVELKRQMAVKVKAQFRANEKSYQNPWCLHYAANYGDMERLDQLVASMKHEAAGDRMVVRALAEERDLDSGRTALHFAARGAQEAAATLLLELGADPNARDPSGMTPLHLAAGWGSKRLCGLLLLKGGDKSMEDSKGRTPIDVARQQQRKQEEAFLKRWLQVGITQAEREKLAEPEPLPPFQARAKEAGDEKLYLQLRNLEMKEQAYGRYGAPLAPTLGRLAAMLRERGHGNEALNCLQRQLTVMQRQLGEDAIETVMVLNNLGELCFALGRHSEAEVCLQRALIVAEDTARAARDRAAAANDATPVANRLLLEDAAAAAGEEKLQRRGGYEERAHPGQHADAARLEQQRGLVPHDAESLGSSVVQRDADAAGVPTPNDELNLGKVDQGGAGGATLAALADAAPSPMLAPAVRNLGLLYFRTGRLERAEPLLRRHLALETRAHVDPHFGSESVGLIPALEVLGYVCALRGRFEEGLRHYRRAKKICLRELGTDHAGVARQQEHEGLVHFCAGDFTNTERCFREAHDTLLRTGLDRFSPEIMRICNNMATAQCRKGPSVF